MDRISQLEKFEQFSDRDKQSNCISYNRLIEDESQHTTYLSFGLVHQKYKDLKSLYRINKISNMVFFIICLYFTGFSSIVKYYNNHTDEGKEES